jgi:predicted AlkP superfamily phosphohydrolase/phosphomutase
MPGKPKVVVVVTEGASPDLLNRWMLQGLLKGFSALHEQGSSGPLSAEGTPYEPPGLVSLLTGRPAADHGIFSYWSVHDPHYRPATLQGSERRYPLMWHLDEFAEVRFACLGVFGAHPVEPLNGSLISYPMVPTLRACYPAELQRELHRRGIRPVHDVSIFQTGQPREELLSQFLLADIERGRATLAMLAEHDVVVVNLTSIDRTSHFYWQELELDGVDVDNAVLSAYRTCDQILSELLDQADSNTTVLAFSEIGFGPLRAYRSINEVLERAGFLQNTPTGAVDWAATRAFEAVQGTHGVNINRRGRYRDGCVADAEYAGIRTEVQQTLLAAINPSTGLPYFSAVTPGEQVYRGEASGQAPDLILEPADWRYLPLGDTTWARHVNRHWQSGWHRRDSYWAAVGPRFPAAHRAGTTAMVVDVPATITDLLERDPPSGWAGHSLVPTA